MIMVLISLVASPALAQVPGDTTASTGIRRSESQVPTARITATLTNPTSRVQTMRPASAGIRRERLTHLHQCRCVVCIIDGRRG